MAMSASARSRMVRPRSSATPYSVIMVSARFREMDTAAPGVSTDLILEMVPPLAVEAKAMMPRPPRACMAPQAKSEAPPVPEYWSGPMLSEQIWPVRSISRAELTLTIWSFWAITQGLLP